MFTCADRFLRIALRRRLLSKFEPLRTMSIGAEAAGSAFLLMCSFAPILSTHVMQYSVVRASAMQHGGACPQNAV